MTFTIRYAEKRPARPVSAVFEALAGTPLYSVSPDVVGQERARKALGRALKARPVRRWKRPALNPGVELASLPCPDDALRRRGRSGGWRNGRRDGSRDAGQERAYAENVGREWAEVDPEPTPEAFGCPPAPVCPEPEHTYSHGYMGKRSTKADDERRAAWYAELEAWDPLRDAWYESEAGERYEAALWVWRARRDQFAYSPRSRDAAAVLADCAVALPGFEQVAA